MVVKSDHPPDLPVAACLLVDGVRAASVTLPNQTIHFRGQTYPCLWGHLWAELPGNPMPGAGGLLLHQLVRRLTKRGVGFAATGPTESAVKVIKRLGIKRVAFCPRFVLAVGAGAVTRKLVKNRALEKAGFLAIGAGVGAWPKLARHRLRREAKAFRRVDLDSWDEDLRILESNPREEYIHVGRSPEFVSWKEAFSHWSAPAMSTRAFSLQRDDEPAGYVNLRYGVHARLGSMGFENAKLLRVMDCITGGPEATAAAFFHTIDIARETKCDFIEFVTNDAWVARAARQATFKESNGMSVFLLKPEGWPREIDDEPDLWNIGLMESDGAFSEAPAVDPSTQ